MARRGRDCWTSAAARRLLELAGNPRSIDAAVSIVAGGLLKGVPFPPTDLDSILPRLNVTGHEPCAELAGSGALMRDGCGFKIVYFPNMSQGRKRWTIAHELGHAMFESTGPNPPRHGRELERLCDMFAAEILLPRSHVAARLSEDFCLKDVLKLASDSATSATAAAIRCAELRRVSVFETDDGELRWGYGLVRHNSDIASDRSLSRLVTATEGDDSGSEHIALAMHNRVGWWIADWQRMGEGRRRLFMLRPA